MTTQEDYRSRLVDALHTIERLQERLREKNQQPAAEPLAIVGLGCRLPGGADTPEKYWELLRSGTDATSEFPAERGDARPYYDPDPDTPGKAYTIRGAFLDRIDGFEPGVFGISPREAPGMDPQQRILLEVAWESLERAGYAPDSLNGSATGVFVGVSTTDYARMRQSEGDIRDVDAYQLVGEPSFAAGRISHTLGLQGPCKVVDTTCSSSLVALHEACQALRLGECDMALAGGVNLMLSPYGFVMMSKFRGLSPDGRCKTFDSSADGYGRGEGAGLVVLKRYSDAVRDGDHIAAVVRGSAVNHDGRSSGLTVPNPAAQRQVIAGALRQAAVPPGDVDYVEAHGTGTALGDPIELRALEAVIGRHRPGNAPLLVGSAKTNIGHLEAAAGIAGLLKLVLALQHGEIPPHLHFTDPNPNLDWDRVHIEVPTGPRPWPRTGTSRVGAVSSFGASGTNAHVVVSAPPEEQPPSREGNGAAEAETPSGPGVLLVSGRTREALAGTADSYARYLRGATGLPLGDVCWTTQTGRARQTHGLAVATDSAEGFAEALEAFSRGARDPRYAETTLPVHKHRRTAWLFTGQGAQYPGMARGLAGEPAFREPFDACLKLFDAFLDRPLRPVIWPPPEEEGGDGGVLDDTRFTQPALFAVEYALARMWQAWGLRPSALLGHSVGEIAAACIAGVFSLKDAVRLVAARSSLMAGLPAGGGMIAVHCDEATARAAIAGYPDTVSLAAVNGPRSVTLSGADGDVTAVAESLRAQGVRTQRLTVSHAFHSPLMRPMLDAFRAVAETLGYSAPDIPLYSNVTGALWTSAETGPEYWVRHAAGAVRFHDGLAGLHGDGVRTFLEVGPAPVLLGLGSRALDDPDCAWVPSLSRPAARTADSAAGSAAGGTGKTAEHAAGRAAADRPAVRRALGTLALRGAAVDWRATYSGGREPRRTPLPSTVWQRERYWFPEPGEGSGDGPVSAAPRGTEVPGAGLRLPGALPVYEVRPDEERWEQLVRTGENGRRRLAPGVLAGAARAAAADAFGGYWSCVADLTLEEHVPVEGDGRVLHLTLEEPAADGVAFRWHSRSPGEEAADAPWRLHARGTVRRRPGAAHGAPEMPGPDGSGGQEAPALREDPSLPPALAGAITGVRRGRDSRGGRQVLVGLAPGHGLPQAGVFEAAAVALSWAAGPEADAPRPESAARGLALTDAVCPAPREVRYVRVTVPPRPEEADHAEEAGRGETAGSAEFFAGDGSRLGGVRALRLGVRDGTAASAPWRRPEDLLLRMEWEPAGAAPAAADLAGESFLLLPDAAGVAGELARELRRRGAHCLVAGPDQARADRGALSVLLERWRREAPAGARGRVAVLTGLDSPAPQDAAPEALEAFRDRSELAVVALVQELLRREDCARTTVGLVTRGSVPAGPESAVTDPFAHTLWGLGRVIALEHPDHWGGSVDLDPSAPEGEAPALLAALLDHGAEDQQALRGEARYVARMRQQQAGAAELRQPPPVRAGGSYLITGAFGGIGQAVARWLADQGAARLVLLGRTPLPPRREWDDPGLREGVRERIAAVRALEETGVQVEVPAADVCDRAQLEGVFRELTEGTDGGRRPLHGVVHAAGVSEPQFLRDIPVSDPRDYDAVWRPKVVGGWLLHELAEGLGLDFFLNFSSIAATWGSQHLSSYSAANAFLDGLAEYRHGLGQPALTVSWGPWELASALFGDDVLEFLTSTGLRTLSAPQCLKLLGMLLGRGAPQAVVCAADWSVYKPVMEARLERPVLRELEAAEETGDGDGETALLAELARTPSQERKAVLVRYLQEVLSGIVAVPAEQIVPAADVMSHGLDSLMVMDVVKRCKQDLRVGLRPHQLFEHATLEEWAELLAAETGGGAPAAAEPAGQGMTRPAAIADDVRLAEDIRPRGPLRESYTDPRHVLLTGATGFLGAYLLDELLATTTAEVHCLVRCGDEAEGLARIRANTEQYLPWRPDAGARVRVLAGDLEKPLLGLSQDRFDDLAGRLDAIYHNGAWVNFSYTYEQLRAANVAGCEEILRLACQGPLTPVSHVSTYGIWGIPEDGRTVIGEDDDIAGAGKLVTGYVQTKWAAELLMMQARERGVPVDIHRPGRVLGDSRSGACLTTHFTTRVVKGCIQLGMAPALDLEVEMTPVDFVTRALVRISRQPHAFGGTYHLINRRRLTFAGLVGMMSRYGWRVKKVPVDTWWQTLQDAFAERDNELHPVMEVVEEFVVGGEEAIDYDATATERALESSGIACPALDGELLETYFGWMVRTGYLPRPEADPVPPEL